jgi:hypothetical protein
LLPPHLLQGCCWVYERHALLIALPLLLLLLLQMPPPPSGLTTHTPSPGVLLGR